MLAQQYDHIDEQEEARNDVGVPQDALTKFPADFGFCHRLPVSSFALYYTPKISARSRATVGFQPAWET